MKTLELKSGSELFHQYLESKKHEVKETNSEGYYPVNVVADAYKQGFSDGEKSGENDFVDRFVKQEIEKFTHKANQIYILSKRIISFIIEKGFEVNSLHINLTFQRPSVIVSVKNDILLNDDFVDLAYSRTFEIKEIYNKLFDDYLDIGLVSSENLDKDMLKDEGFGYTESYDQ